MYEIKLKTVQRTVCVSDDMFLALIPWFEEVLLSLKEPPLKGP